MKYFAALLDEGGFTQEPPPPDEFMIPDIPMGDKTEFIGIPSFKTCPRARIREDSVDPDGLLKRLIAEYPGLPPDMLNKFIVDTLVAAAKVPGDHVYRVNVTRSSAVVQSVSVDGLVCVIWDDLDPSKFI